MERVRIYDVRNGDIDYHNLLSGQKDFIFWNEDVLKKARPGDVVFFVNREEKEVLFTVATEEVCTGVRNPRTWLKEFEYHQCVYGGKEGDEFRKYDVRQVAVIPRHWKWSRPLRLNGVADLWGERVADSNARLIRTHDLQSLFPGGPAFEILQRCSLHIGRGYPTASQRETGGKRFTIPGSEKGYKGIPFSHPYRQLLMAVKTKPFVLLSGVSGTGKSWLVRKLAHITCADPALRKARHPGNFEIVRVRPDWHEPDDLLGYPVTQGNGIRYHSTDLLRFIVKASRYPHIPFFACLDEMNLARIEHYFSDFLSILETGRREGDEIIYDAFISSHNVLVYSQEDPGFWSRLGIADAPLLQACLLERGIVMPPNLTVIGTINMDETTHGLSQRVLDRTLVIEMQNVDMEHGLLSPGELWEYPDTYEAATELTTGRLNGPAAYNNRPKTGTQIIRELKRIYEVLKDTPFALSYRVREDVLLYCTYNEALAANGPLPHNWLNLCLDEVICMKILTRITGDDAACGDIIERLLAVTQEYPACQRKLSKIRLQLRKTGLTSFW